MIEVGHNENQLMHRAKCKVRNVIRADKDIRRMMDTTRTRGMKLRYAHDYLTGHYYLEARERCALDVALRVLRANHNLISLKREYKPLGE